MNCPKCTTPADPGASHCRRCGNPLTAKAAAAASAVPDEIDLMPMEAPKESAFSPYEPPPGIGGASAAPAPEAPAAGTKSRPKPPPPPPEPDPPGAKIGLYIGGAILALFLLFILWKIVKPKHELVSGQNKLESTVVLNPGQVHVKHLEILGSLTYRLEVEPLDYDISVGVFKRGGPREASSLGALKKLPEGFETAGKGDTFTKSAELKTGHYSWVLVNEGKKPAKVKFKFVIE